MTIVARYPDSTKTSLEQRLRARARERWPQIASLHIRHRGNFSYVDATLTGDTSLKLCRLRYVGSAQRLAVRDLPRQPRRLRRIGLLHRPARRHLPRRPRHRLRPLPQRPHRLDPTPDELTGETTKHPPNGFFSQDRAIYRVGGLVGGRSPGLDRRALDRRITQPSEEPGQALLAHDYTSLWAYMVGPLTGAVIAVTAFDHLLPLQTLTAKLSHDSRYPSTMATRLAPDHTSASEAKLRALR